MDSWPLSEEYFMVAYYSCKADSCWRLKRLCKVENTSIQAFDKNWVWQSTATGQSTVKEGYSCLQGNPTKVLWERLVWNKSNITKHSYIIWILMQKVPNTGLGASYI